MSTVSTLETAEACVFEGGVVAMAAYDNGHGLTVYKVCMSQAEVADLETSPYVDPTTIIWHYQDDKWKIPPKEAGE